MREFSVLIRRAPDVPGQWLAHCLNWDVIAYAPSIPEAMDQLARSLIMVIEDDEAMGLVPDDRPSAPEDHWEIYLRIQKQGKDVELETVVRRAAEGLVLAGTLRMAHLKVPVGQTAEQSLPMARRTGMVPPPFVIRAIEEHSNGLGRQ
jgi:hypothetical protein